jgi:hypothetical protein
LFGDVIKRHFTLVKVEFAGNQVACEIEILQAIVVKISGCDPTTVVHILLVYDIDRISFYDGVGEFNSGSGRLKFLEKGVSGVARE